VFFTGGVVLDRGTWPPGKAEEEGNLGSAKVCSILLHYDLVDLGYQGYRYTWRNGRFENVFVEECLDRACANPK